jgi:glycerophosphoryl diester phosphodiesterase
MQKATTHARSYGAQVPPVLSPDDAAVLGLPSDSGTGPSNQSLVPIAALHAIGVRVIPWTTNDPEKMRALIRLGVDGIISDRPDLVQKVLAEERAAATGKTREKLTHFDVAAHRGGRGLRPENTLPSFESGLDQLSTTLETDTGVTTDHVSLIWHDQFLNPQSCRHADGSPYTMENRVYTRDISLAQAQTTFICDKLRKGGYPDGVQTNDLALSPVAVAFAAKEHMPSPYAPTYAAQLMRFVRFYTAYYSTGPGRTQPHAAERAANAEKARFNLETKIIPPSRAAQMLVPKGVTIPPEMLTNHTVEPQVFVDTLVGEILAEHMEARSEVQSFDFRTLVLVEAQHPRIPTYYLTENPALFTTDFVPASLRLAPTH